MASNSAPHKRFYVIAEKSKGTVVAYCVRDCVGGMESEHARFSLKEYSVDVALHLANLDRDERNAACEPRFIWSAKVSKRSYQWKQEKQVCAKNADAELKTFQAAHPRLFCLVSRTKPVSSAVPS